MLARGHQKGNMLFRIKKKLKKYKSNLTPKSNKKDKNQKNNSAFFTYFICMLWSKGLEAFLI
jgi:hypothetical protein